MNNFRGACSLVALTLLLSGTSALEGCSDSPGGGGVGGHGGNAGSTSGTAGMGGGGGTAGAGSGVAGAGGAGTGGNNTAGAGGTGTAGAAGNGTAGAAGGGAAGTGGAAGGGTAGAGGAAGGAGQDGGAGAAGHDGGTAGHDAAVDVATDSGHEGGVDAAPDVPSCGADGTSCATANGATGYCAAHVCKACVDPTDDAKCVTAYGAGQLCIAGKCVAGDCHSSTGCTAGQVCGAAIANKCGICSSDAQCQTDTRYGATFICNTTTGQAQSGKCVSSACTAVGTCAANAGDTCCNLKCVTGNCCSDDDCHTNTQFGPTYFCSANHVCSTCAAPTGNQYFVDPIGGIDATATGSGKVGTAAVPTCSFRTITRALQVIGNAPAGTTITVVGVANMTTALAATEHLPILVPANVKIATSVGPISVTLAANGSGFTLAGDGASIAAAAVAPLMIDGANHGSGLGIAVAPGAGKVTALSNVAIKNTGDDGIAVMNGTLSIGAGVTVTGAGHATATGRRSGLHVAGGVVNIVVPAGQTPSTFNANTLHGIEVSDLGVLNVVGVPVLTPAITGAGTVVASGNSRTNIFIGQTPGMAPSLSALDGLVAWNSANGAGIEISAGSKIKVRNCVSLENATDGVLITTADATTAGESVSDIDLGVAGNFGHNVLQVTAVAGGHENPGAGLCVALDANSGAQSVAAAGNVFAGPLDCSKITPGAALIKAATCANHVDEGIVPATGTTATIVSSNCL
jgi:hypothetical protein